MFFARRKGMSFRRANFIGGGETKLFKQIFGANAAGFKKVANAWRSHGV